MRKSKTPKIERPLDCPPIALVAWEDAKLISDGGAWMENRELHYEPHIVWQAGFILKDEEVGIIIVEAWHKDLIGNPTQIPRGMIRSIKYL
jgi:hypothetical protein